jgi:hypothetical protein
VLADLLLRARPWGANAFVVTVVALACLGFVRRGLGEGWGNGGPTAGAVVLLAALGLASRDALVLKALDVLTLFMGAGFLAGSRGGLAHLRSTTHDAVRCLGALVHSAIGPVLLATQDIRWRDVAVGRVVAASVSAARGTLLAVPVLAVFTLLLGNADAVFALRLREALDVDLFAVLGHVAVASACGWMATGFLHASLLREEPASVLPSRPAWLAAPAGEVAVALGLVDLLFGAFVWIQVRYLFGGAAFVEATLGLTYSQYARRGFFELVAVAALVLGLLLFAHWLTEPRGRSGLLSVLSLVQVLLVLVMLASAYERMRLYRAEFGLTELRLYTTAFMLWLGVLLAGFLATVPRGRRDSFARFSCASAVAALVALHVADPEARIVEANRRSPHGFDLRYALGLGADAVPALLEAREELGDTDRQVLARCLLALWGDDDGDWRTWSVSLARARRLVRRSAEALRAEAGGAACALPTRP